MNSHKPAWLRVLSQKNFRLMLGGVFLGHCGTWMQITAIGWFIYKTTNDKTMLALFASAEMIPLALFGPLLGSISDHVDKKKLLLFCELIFVILAFAGGCLVSIPGIHPIYLAGLAFLEGINGAIEAPARMTLTSSFIPKEDLSAGMPLQSSTFQAARFIGPVMAGIILKFFGTPACFFVNAFSYAVLFTIIMRMPSQAISTSKKKLSLKHSSKEVFHHILKEPYLRFLFMLLLAGSLCGSFYVSLVPAFVKDVLLLDEIGLGQAMGAMGIGGVAALIFLLLIANKPIQKYIAPVAIVGLGATLLLLSLTASAMIAFITLALAAFSTTTYIVSIRTIGQMIAPLQMRGRILSIDIWIVFGLASLSYPVFGWLAELTSIQFVLQIGGLFTLIIGLIGLRHQKKVFGLRYDPAS